MENNSNNNGPDPALIPLSTNSKTTSTVAERPADSERNHLDLIIPNLYLGNITAANDSKLLDELKITHVLTIEDSELDFEKYKDLEKYKFKKLADNTNSNVLDVIDECLEFIDDAIKDSKNVLVHCYEGVSRSATIVIAYIMAKQKQSIKKTLDQVRKKRFVKPNLGFYKQLELFQAMDFKVCKTSGVFRAFKLEYISKQIQLGNGFKEIEKNMNGKLTNLDDENNNNSTNYKCKKCRYLLFSENKVVPHIKSYEQNTATSWNKRLAYYKQLGSVTSEPTEASPECRAELYIEPLDWFKDRLEELNGKLNCPKCDVKIGSFDWCGSICSCNTWVTPAFHISVTKVDICRPIHESQLIRSDPKLHV